MNSKMQKIGTPPSFLAGGGFLFKMFTPGYGQDLSFFLLLKVLVEASRREMKKAFFT